MPVYQDGSTQFGSQSIAVTPPAGGASTAYDLKDITITRPSNRILSKNPSGLTTKKVHVPQLVTGSATAQLETLNTAAPVLYGSFTLIPAGGGTPEPYLIDEVGERYEQEGEVMCPIVFSAKLN